MDAQHAAVTRFVAACRGRLLAQYVEVESGKRADRPELQQAFDQTKQTRATLHILAAVAEHERQMISERTKAALAAAKARGTRLGAPHGSDPSAMRAERTRAAAVFRDWVAPDVKRLAR